MTSLIQHQESCIARMHERRTSERRAHKNRVAAIRQYRKYAAGVGCYSEADIEQQVRDIQDVYKLQRDAEEQ